MCATGVVAITFNVSKFLVCVSKVIPRDVSLDDPCTWRSRGKLAILDTEAGQMWSLQATFESGHKVMAWKFLKVLTEA